MGPKVQDPVLKESIGIIGQPLGVRLEQRAEVGHAVDGHLSRTDHGGVQDFTVASLTLGPQKRFVGPAKHCLELCELFAWFGLEMPKLTVNFGRPQTVRAASS